MKVRLFAAMTSLALLAAIAAPAATGADQTTTNEYGSVLVAADDIAFDGPGCVQVPAAFTFARIAPGKGTYSLTVVLDVRQEGSNRAEQHGASLYSYEASPVTKQSTIQVCPWTYEPSAGPYKVTGSFQATLSQGEVVKTPMSPFNLNVVMNQTSMRLRVKASTTQRYELSGEARARTITHGVIGAEGVVVITGKKPGSAKWHELGRTDTDQFGRWHWSASYSELASKWKVKAALTGCEWCTDAAAEAVIR